MSVGARGDSAQSAVAVGTEFPNQQPADGGLLSTDEVVAALRTALGDEVPEGRLVMAAARIHQAIEARWEHLPPEINPEVGFHYPFLVCTETCWLGRQVLIEGATFRIFRLRE